jgi:hypothetical protein
MTENISADFHDGEETHYCEIHPDRETELRCNKCGRYMCAQCAVSTPVGYRCRECVRQVDDKFFNIGEKDYTLAFAVSAGIGLISGMVFNYVNFLLLAIFAGILIASGVEMAVKRVIERRRGRYTGEVTVGGLIAGGIIGGAIISWLRYPADFAEFWERVNRLPNRDQILRNMQFVPPTLSDYIMSNTFSIGMIAFLGIAAFIVYSRMKT